jgi:hypothetical protein
MKTGIGATKITLVDLQNAYQKSLDDLVDGLNGNLGVIKDACLCFRDHVSDKQFLARLVCVIDSTNSTGLSRRKRVNAFGVMDVVQFCMDHGFPNVVKNQRPSDVDTFINEFAKPPVKGIVHPRLISFFSKLFCYYDLFVFNQDGFSIYDSVVLKKLPDYYHRKSFASIQASGSTRYQIYSAEIEDILKSNGITSEDLEFRRRAFDNFVWGQYSGK